MSKKKSEAWQTCCVQYRLLINDWTIAVRRMGQNHRHYLGWVETLPGWGRRWGCSPLSGGSGPPQYSHLDSSLLVKSTETKAHKEQYSINTIQYVIPLLLFHQLFLIYSIHSLHRQCNNMIFCKWNIAQHHTSSVWHAVWCVKIHTCWGLRLLQREVCVFWQVKSDPGCGWRAVCQSEWYCSVRASIDPIKLEMGLERRRKKFTQVAERGEVLSKVDISWKKCLY